MTTHVLCDVCGEGHVASVYGQNEIEHKGATFSVPFVMSHCEVCGSDYASASDMRQNKRAVVELRKKLECLLTGQAVHAIRVGAGLKKVQAVKIFGGGPVAFSKYEADDVTQSASMDKLIRVAAQVPSALAWLAHAAGEEEVATAICSREVSRISTILEVDGVLKDARRVVHAVLKHTLLDSPVSCYSKVFVSESSEEDELAVDVQTGGTVHSMARFVQRKNSAYEMSLDYDAPASNLPSALKSLQSYKLEAA
ncbi:type II toxin-antitoxin system MqsA family antitoxin [Cupriavidus sp. UYPR2.512]|uniref:type II toxin-antitoxin system MqsA family antitoxin n=1 Tax=Cupriavidus sp. UYPR2.512 TaxID=1080187 RepID=UPI000375A287|nr:type II toxin-antitoxin system MqsA family antitoxin [Cupriavidus sp. UYPR2.512]UIF88907.1 type II toxin-antitoxin system MqsA family antitoxin [Cupriavidus necator]